jgi:hypothetical protein
MADEDGGGSRLAAAALPNGYHAAHAAPLPEAAVVRDEPQQPAPRRRAAAAAKRPKPKPKRKKRQRADTDDDCGNTDDDDDDDDDGGSGTDDDFDDDDDDDSDGDCYSIYDTTSQNYMRARRMAPLQQRLAEFDPAQCKICRCGPLISALKNGSNEAAEAVPGVKQAFNIMTLLTSEQAVLISNEVLNELIAQSWNSIGARAGRDGQPLVPRIDAADAHCHRVTCDQTRNQTAYQLRDALLVLYDLYAVCTRRLLVNTKREHEHKRARAASAAAAAAAAEAEADPFDMLLQPEVEAQLRPLRSKRLRLGTDVPANFLLHDMQLRPSKQGIAMLSNVARQIVQFTRTAQQMGVFNETPLIVTDSKTGAPVQRSNGKSSSSSSSSSGTPLSSTFSTASRGPAY